MQEWWRGQKNKWIITDMESYLAGLREGSEPVQSFERRILSIACFAVAIVAVIGLAATGVVIIILL